MCALSPASLDRFYFTKFYTKQWRAPTPLNEGGGFNHVSGKYLLFVSMELVNHTRPGLDKRFVDLSAWETEMNAFQNILLLWNH